MNQLLLKLYVMYKIREWQLLDKIEEKANFFKKGGK